ncbi:MAG: DMT family transporter [Bacteriovoracaceae bacterium]
MGYILLIFITFIWGMGFIAVKWTLLHYTAMESNLIRFAIAAILAIPIVTLMKAWKVSQAQLKGVFVCSLFLFSMLYLQTWGLAYTSVAKSGFLSTLYVFITPLLCMFFFRQRYSWGYWFLILLGLVGIFLLGDMSFDGFNFGDLLTLLCSFFAAFHILSVEKYSPLFPHSLVFNCFQIFFVTLFSMTVFVLRNGTVRLEPMMSWQSLSLWGFFILSVMSSLVAFSFQASAQKKLPSHVVSMLFLLESPFAALMGYIILGETLTMVATVGCGLILLSVILVPKFAKLNQV